MLGNDKKKWIIIQTPTNLLVDHVDVLPSAQKNPSIQYALVIPQWPSCVIFFLSYRDQGLFLVGLYWTYLGH